MKYIAAYCLLALGGNENPSEDDLRKFLKSCEVETNDDQLKACVSALKGKQLHELCQEGLSQIGSMAVGGSGAGAGGQDQGAQEENKEEEKPETEEESEDMDMGGLFD